MSGRGRSSFLPRNRAAAVIGAALLLSLALAVPVAASSVVPVFVTGNPTCADRGFDNELKIDPPKAGTFDVGDGKVTISNIDTSVNPATFTWSSTGVTIAAIIVKGGNGGQGEGANVYSYNPPATTTDSGLHAANGFSHINICWNDQPPPAKGSLKITKVVTGGPGGFEGTFDIHVDCGQDGIFNTSIDYPTPGFATITNMPAGAQCTVTESAADNPPAFFSWGTVTVTGSPATIVANETANAVVTNPLVRQTGSIKITKAIPGVPEDFEGSFEVTVDCGQGITFDRTITYPDPGFVTVSGILTGLYCTVSEGDRSDPPAGTQWGQADITGNPILVGSGTTADVTVTNPLTEIPPETGSLKVTKDIPNVPGDFTGSFDVRVTCTDGDPIDRTISFPDPGFITVDGLPAGAVCAVIETGRSDPPDGTQWAGPLFAGTATIVADQTAAITVTNLLAEQNAVTPPPEVPTPPPTDSAVPNGTSSSGFSLMIATLLMLGVAGGILAFAPTSIRKRKR